MTLSLGNAIDSISKLNVLDPLCRIYNRNGFNKNAEYLFRQCVETATPVTVCFVDMDGLKGINDSYGHHEGDFAIKAMSDAISLACGTVNICGRFGGDEFVILGTGSDFAEKFKKRLTARLASQNRKHDKPYKLSASLGYITTVPKSTDSLFDLIQKADERMYEVKKENRTHRI
jgi:diguanylate cyclase (GGDEF) domain